MTNREEIERLLNQTGRTLERLPEDYGDKKLELWNSFHDKTFGYIKSFDMENRILHQSDVIELLVGALRDALDKPMQKPLTLDDVKNAGVVFVEYQYTKELRTAFVVKSANNRDFNVIAAKGTSTLRDCTLTQMSNPLFGKIWRAWASKPTDEEREAAAWEV